MHTCLLQAHEWRLAARLVQQEQLHALSQGLHHVLARHTLWRGMQQRRLGGDAGSTQQQQQQQQQEEGAGGEGAVKGGQQHWSDGDAGSMQQQEGDGRGAAEHSQQQQQLPSMHSRQDGKEQQLMDADSTRPQQGPTTAQQEEPLLAGLPTSSEHTCFGDAHVLRRSWVLCSRACLRESQSGRLTCGSLKPPPRV